MVRTRARDYNQLTYGVEELEEGIRSLSIDSEGEDTVVEEEAEVEVYQPLFTANS